MPRDAAVGEAAAAVIEEHGGLVAARRGALGEVALQRGGGLGAGRAPGAPCGPCRARGASASARSMSSRLRPDQFADAQAAAVEQFEDGAVARRDTGARACPRRRRRSGCWPARRSSPRAVSWAPSACAPGAARLTATTPSRSRKRNSARTAASLRRMVTAARFVLVEVGEPFAEHQQCRIARARAASASGRREVVEELRAGRRRSCGWCGARRSRRASSAR